MFAFKRDNALTPSVTVTSMNASAGMPTTPPSPQNEAKAPLQIPLSSDNEPVHNGVSLTNIFPEGREKCQFVLGPKNQERVLIHMSDSEPASQMVLNEDSDPALVPAVKKDIESKVVNQPKVRQMLL